MRILSVISSTNPEGGGPIEGIKQLQSPLRNLGVAVEIATCDAPSEPWLSARNLPPVHALGPSVGNYRYTPRLVPWLRQNVSRFDAVILHGLWQYPGLAVRRVLAGSTTPYFVFTHGMLDPWFKHHYPLKHLKKWLYWPWAEYRVLRDARTVLFTSEEERRLAEQSFWLHRWRPAVVRYGTSRPQGDAEQQAIAFRERYGLGAKRIILFAGRLHPKKGCDLLISAFAPFAKRDPTLHLVLMGPDQVGWQSELEGRAKDAEISDRITWTGMLEGDLKWGAFHAADVFALPSHQENFGIVVAEALACGVPVLLSDQVNIWQEVTRAGAGLTAKDTLSGTSSLLAQWFALSPGQQAGMRSSALECFQKNFSIDRCAESLLAIVHGES